MTKFFLHTAPTASFPCPPTPKQPPPVAPLADLKKECSHAETKVLPRRNKSASTSQFPRSKPPANQPKHPIISYSSLTHPFIIAL